MASPPKPKPKIDKTALTIYCIIGVAALIGCILLGGAMDCSIDQTGHLDLTRMSNGFQYVLSHPAFLVSHLTDKSSYIPKMLFVCITVVGIYALYKYSEEKKRLHRRGTEHGSAKWGDEKEMKKLSDPTPCSFQPIKVVDTFEFQIEWGKPDNWNYQNSIYTLITDKKQLVLSFRIVKPESEQNRVDTSVTSDKPEQLRIGMKLEMKEHPNKDYIGRRCVIDEISTDEDETQTIHAVSPDSHRVYDKDGNFMGVMVDNNILLTKEVYLSLNAKQHLLNFNILIIGGSGSGKTRFFAKPNIMQLNTSYVITDPKGEILQSTGEMLRAVGYKVRVFNLIQMEHSNNYNPFHYVYDEHGQVSENNVNKMVNVLFSATKKDGEREDFWSKKGQSMLQAIIFLLFEESEYNAEKDANGRIVPKTRDESHLNFFSVTEKMRRLQYPPRGSQLPDGYFLSPKEGESETDFEARREKAFLCDLDRDFLKLEKRKPDSLAIRLYKEVRNAPEETGQSFLSSANANTFNFNLKNLRNLTCCDNIHLETLGDEKTALFIIISATDATYNFMAAMMYTQLFDTLANRANFVHGGVLPVHVRCIMDEFANIGQIPDFDKVIAFVRSMGMSLNVIIQNLAQLKARYEKTWEVITGNCDTTIFLGGKEESTLKSISEQLGKETIDVRGHNRTKGRQSSTSENNSILGRELMQPNELSTMPISDCIVMIRSHNPFYCTKYPIEKHPNYKYLGDSGEILPPFDVSRVHAVTVEEFEAEQKAAHRNVDTNVNPNTSTSEKTIQLEETQKITTYFQQSDTVQVSAETLLPASYEEAEDYLEESGQQISVTNGAEQYTEVESEFDIPNAWESDDFGEPIKDREEVAPDDESKISPVTDPTDTQYYGIPTEEPIFEAELDIDSIEAAVPVTSQHYPRMNTLYEEDEFYDNDMDSVMS